ncbi:aminotransferase class I/II-fold pyridoxal phosphate-dependent enzyme [Roseovarius carneus]|uniref:aminotransferase class I/II-fold pyridoxal phosphate-dependent enzyme n=1 Tax=Roseovarius carneus TaxID=2853164 RepID=UPI001CCDD87D|nr:aminotransferase class I/II-fold pyridoxal phosphate-dependent enzyme [Roseovarius carneus]
MTHALPHIAAMTPYALADMVAPPGIELISLSQNESLRPPSPEAVRAATQSLADAGYPDPDWTDLRAALGDLHAITAEGILCGTGSLDLIGCLMRAVAGSGRAVLSSAHAYPFFKTAAQIANARFDTGPEQGCTVSVDALLDAVQPDTRVVFVANPENPTGTRIPKSELTRLRAGLRADILLVLDEAYGEFADHLGERCWDMVDVGNCAVLRTFSKAYGMAGYRVGWGLFPSALRGEIRKVMNPNNVTRARKRIGFASPYMPAINALAVGFLSEMGFEIVAQAEVDAALGNHEQGALAPEAVYALGLRADGPEVEAIVLSCTEMRSVETLDRLEQKVGKPVISSNQAMMFETLLALGIGEPVKGFGALLERPR